jgi:uncharacterized membrane protein YfcA
MALILVIFFLAGFVKGVIGLGLPTLSMGLLTTVMEPAVAASILIIPSFVTNIWQLMIGGKFLNLARRFYLFIIAIFIGTVYSPLPKLSSASEWVFPALGLILIIYGLVAMFLPKSSISSKNERWLSPLVGYITGVITAATGVFVIPAVPYLQSLNLNKNELIQTLGLAFTASTIALAILLIRENSSETIDYYTSSIALIPAIIGMYAGQYCRNLISEKIFRRCFFFGLIALGVYMLFK